MNKGCNKMSPVRASIFGLLFLVGLVAFICALPYMTEVLSKAFLIVGDGLLYLCSLTDYINVGISALIAWAFLTFIFADGAENYKFAKKIIYLESSLNVLNIVFAIAYLNYDSAYGHLIGVSALIGSIIVIFMRLLTIDDFNTKASRHESQSQA